MPLKSGKSDKDVIVLKVIGGTDSYLDSLDEKTGQVWRYDYEKWYRIGWWRYDYEKWYRIGW